MAGADVSLAPSGGASRLFWYGVLFVAIMGVSASGALLKALDATPPMLKSFWRLLVTTLVQAPFFAREYRAADRLTRAKFWQRRTLLVLTASGLALSVHFGAWIWSLDHTSLAHSLLFVSCHPLLVVVLSFCAGTRLSVVEVGGVLVGFGGAALMMLDVRSDREISWLGNFVAFVGAVMMVIYMYAGRNLRSWMSLFLYATPVTCLSWPPLLLAALLWEDVRWDGIDSRSVFGFLIPTHSLPFVLLVVIVSGIFGHTGINAVLRHISPLTVSIALATEPLFGTLIGLAFGDPAPHTWTLVGGPINLIGTAVAIFGTWRREDALRRAGPVAEASEERPAGTRGKDAAQEQLRPAHEADSSSAELRPRGDAESAAELSRLGCA